MRVDKSNQKSEQEQAVGTANNEQKSPERRDTSNRTCHQTGRQAGRQAVASKNKLPSLRR